MNTGKSKIYLILLTLTATLGGLLFGYDTAVISGAVASLKQFFITPLLNDPEAASKMIFQFKFIGVLSFLFIYFLIISFLKKIFVDTKRTVLYSVISGLFIGSIIYYLFLQHGNTLNEGLINVIHGFNISSALIGCIIGGSIGGYISQGIGRKKGLILAASLFIISAIGAALPDKLNFLGSQTICMFMVYRIIGGIGVGLASMLSPMYIAEIAPAEIRGRLVSFNQFAIIFGMLVVYFVNYFIAKGEPQEWIDTIGWRWMFASGTIPALLFFVMLFLVPETPRFLMYKNNETKALEVLNKVVGKEKAAVVVAEIKNSLIEKSAPWLSFGGLVIVIGILLSVFQQFVGINVVLYYAPEIFRTLGNGTDSALLQTILVGIINLTFTVVAILSVDRFGRRKLQIIGALGMAVSMFGLGMIFYLQKLGFSALICMLVYVASFAMSWGPVTWVLLSEIFPNSIKGAMSIAVAAQWLANLFISTTFPMMNDSSFLTNIFHHGFAYWIYAVMGILAAVFMFKMVPETKGKTLEEIQSFWKK
ncbi:MAG TPA: D-xylose transporter XylE [Bacteroidales bacterium]